MIFLILGGVIEEIFSAVSQKLLNIKYLIKLSTRSNFIENFRSFGPLLAELKGQCQGATIFLIASCACESLSCDICNIFTAKIFRIILNGETLLYSGLS